MSQSIFTGQQFFNEHVGQWWEASLSFPMMTRTQADQWETFLLELRGMKGTFHFGDPFRQTPRGSVTGSPLVNGANQTGNTLDINGLTASSAFLLKGDFIEVGSGLSRRIYRLLEDHIASGAGECTLSIFPALHESPADASTVVTSGCKGTFRLAAPVSFTIQNSLEYGVGFAMREAI